MTKKNLQALVSSMIKFETQSYLIFFGNNATTEQGLKTEFPSMKIKKIRQTHSDKVVFSGSDMPEADAHYTDKKNQALMISTADCMPIMIYCRQTHRAAAVHAGWRGVVNKITEKTLRSLIQSGSSESDFLIFIGPHIQQQSFQVQEDSRLLLSTAHYNLESRTYCNNEEGGYKINLSQIVRSQIENIIGKPAQIYLSEIDTKTNFEFNSYRREPQNSKRNLSFIALLN